MLRKATALLLLAAACAAQRTIRRTIPKPWPSARRQRRVPCSIVRWLQSAAPRRCARSRSCACSSQGENWPRLADADRLAAVRSRHPAGNAAARPEEQSPEARAARERRGLHRQQHDRDQVRAGRELRSIARTRSRRFRSRSRASSSSFSTTAACRTCCCARRSIAKRRCARSARIRSRASRTTCSRS